MDRTVGKHSGADLADDVVRQHPADDAVDVDDRQLAVHAFAPLDRWLRVLDQLVVDGVGETVVLIVYSVHAEAVLGLGGGLQDRGEVQALRLPVFDRRIHLEGVHPADHVVDGAETELRHDEPQFLGDHEEVVDDMLRGARELAAEIRVLGRDAHRTGVQVALAHHDAAHGHQRRGGEAELLGPQERGDGDVPSGLQLAVGLQRDARAQVVHHQGLMGLGDAQLPRHAGVLDGRQRRRPGAAGIAGDHQVIRSRLDDAGRNRADADLGAQLDADARLGVAVLQVVDELGDVLDGIDVVVRRRADEAHAGRRVADPGDVVVHLAPRQFAALPRLRALDDLDLQFVGVGQVVDRDAEAAAGHLLDGRTLGVAVRQRDEALGVFAALAGVRLAADAVHGDGEALVGFRGDRSEAHGTGGETLDDLGGGLDLVQRNLAAVGPVVERQQATQRRAPGALLVGLLGEPPVGLFVIAPGRDLEIGDGLRVPHVGVAVAAPVEVAGVRQHRQRDHVPGREAERVTALHLLGQDVEADALDPARGTLEAAFHDILGKPHGFEDLRALVGLERGDAHLGHDLEHALGDALPVALDDVVIGRDVVRVHEVAVASRVPEGLEGEIRVDGVRTEADQQAMVMHLAGFAGLDDEADAGAGQGAHQVVMHGPRRGQRADRHVVGTDGAVAQDDEFDAGVDGGGGLRADPVESREQAGFAGIPREGDVDGARPPAAVANVRERRQLVVGQDRVRHTQPVGVLLRRLEQVALRSDGALQRHDDLLADRVDGGIRDLREELLEVVVEHARLVGHHRQGAVVAHGTQWIAQLGDERQQHELHGLRRVAEGLHAWQKCGLVESGRFGGRDVVQFHPLPFQPLAVGSTLGPLGLDLLVGDQATRVEVDEEDLAGLQAALGHHLGRVDVDDPHLGGHDALVVFGDVVARRPESVAVEHGTDVGAVGEGDGRRAVPGFHQAGVVLVEGALRRVHGRVLLPGLRDHHQHRFLERPPGHEQELQDVVERTGVGTVRFDHREQLRQVVAEQVALHHALAGVHPVLVAEQRVDLAVVAHEAVRLRPVPGREGVGGEPRVHHGEMRFVVRILEVRVERKELVRRQHALVDDDLGGQADEEQQQALGQAVVGAQAVGGRLADEIELAFERVAFEVAADEQLLHGRHRRPCRVADVRLVGSGGYGPPAEKPLSGVGDLLLDDRLATCALMRGSRQKDDPRTVVTRFGEFDAKIPLRGLGQEPVG